MKLFLYSRFLVTVTALAILAGCAARITSTKAENYSEKIRAVVVITTGDLLEGHPLLAKRVMEISNELASNLNSRKIMAGEIKTAELGFNNQERLQTLVSKSGVDHYLILRVVELGRYAKLAREVDSYELELALVDMRSKKLVWRSKTKASFYYTSPVEAGAALVNQLLADGLL